jgi:hypothetical protein
MFTPNVTRALCATDAFAAGSRDNLPGLEDMWDRQIESLGTGDRLSCSPSLFETIDEHKQPGLGAAETVDLGLLEEGEVCATDVPDGDSNGDGDGDGDGGSSVGGTSVATAQESVTGLGIRKSIRAALGLGKSKPSATASSSAAGGAARKIDVAVGVVARESVPVQYASLNEAAKEQNWSMLNFEARATSRRFSEASSSSGLTGQDGVTTGDTTGDSPFPAGTVGTLTEVPSPDFVLAPTQAVASKFPSRTGSMTSLSSVVKSVRDTDSESEEDEFSEAGLDGSVEWQRKKRTVWTSLEALTKIPVFYFLLGAMSSLYFTVTGVQYWGTSYMQVALGAPVELVNAMFIVCAATGPTLGVFFGGWCIDKRGGYKGPVARVRALEVLQPCHPVIAS